ncbi:hypothetical protein EGW08_017785 [Elysia chlorotica]|uniref:Uncharacterized protein n=1 Tax=Elysia chlorotica TaxID=188477 RepID=A0A433SYU6_ELYCH|nr:hypothetical protein EGW08_017785 [Elysia chlorotica]
MSLTSPEANQRNKIIRPAETSETDQHQQMILLSHIQTAETSRIPSESCQNSQHSNSDESRILTTSGNFRLPSSKVPSSSDDFRSASLPSRPNSFRSMPAQHHRSGSEVRESPIAVNNSSTLHNLQPRSSEDGSFSNSSHLSHQASPARHLGFDPGVKTAPSLEVYGRDLELRHYAEANLRSNNCLSPEAPRDKGGKIYAAFVLGGVGYMLPFTCFVVAVDFYQPHCHLDQTASGQCRPSITGRGAKFGNLRKL